MNTVVNAANTQAAYDEQQRISMIISLGIGPCGRLTVAVFGLVKQQGWLGAVGLFLCLIGGYFGGWILVIPLCGGLSAAINEQAKYHEAQVQKAAREDEERKQRERNEAAARLAEQTWKTEAARWAQVKSQAQRQAQPVHQAAPPVAASRSSQVAAVRWCDRLNDPQVQLEDLPDGVRIVTTPPVLLYRGAYAERAALLGETPLTLDIDGGCHQFNGYIDRVWAVAIMLDAADRTAQVQTEPIKAAAPATEHALIVGLERLASLRGSGTLTDDEFTAAKAVLLNGNSTPA